MAENEGLDLSRIVNLIMENPKLIEEISALAKSEKTEQAEEATTQTIAVTEAEQNELAKETNTYKKPERNRRSELLCAMKPYLSKERAKAIDSMLTIIDVFDMMKER